MMITPDGAQMRQLTSTDAHNHSPEWSPDGLAIAFNSQEGVPWGVWMVSRDSVGMPWGDPDLQGVWTTDWERSVPFERSTEFGDRAELTAEEIAERAGEEANRTS